MITMTFYSNRIKKKQGKVHETMKEQLKHMYQPDLHLQLICIHSYTRLYCANSPKYINNHHYIDPEVAPSYVQKPSQLASGANPFPSNPISIILSQWKIKIYNFITMFNWNSVIFWVKKRSYCLFQLKGMLPLVSNFHDILILEK